MHKPFSRWSSAVLATVALACGITPLQSRAIERGPSQPRAAIQPDAQQARVIVKFKADTTLMQALSAGRAPGARPQHAAALAQRLRMTLQDGRVLGSRTQGLVGSGMSSGQLATQLAAMPEVEWAVPDMRRSISALPNDPYLPSGQTAITPASGQWYLRAPDATLVSAINAVGAWDVTPGSAAITVAVLDTGVRFDHPDLAGKLYAGYDFVHDAATANDGDGRDTDASDPGDWTAANECKSGEAATTSRWHGTQVAGLLGAATNNGIGMAGVGRNIMVLPVRVLGRCGGYDSDIIAAMRWAAGVSSEVGFGTSATLVNSHPARVINMSLGSTGSCPASYRDAIAEVTAAGVAVVVAAGNDTGQAVSTPANCAGAIAVAGVRHVGSKVGYSNVGPEIAIAAPAGNCVNLVGTCLYPLLTTINTGTTTPLANTYSDGGGNASIGTSFSAPIVAGTVGLMLSVNPALSPAQLKTALQATARAFPTTGGDPGTAACHAPNGVDQLECYCTTSTCGAGMLNAALAVGKAAEPAANIAASAAAPAVGSAVTLSAAASGASIGRSIANYRWSITSGATLATLSGPTEGATVAMVTLNAISAGTVVVQLAVTDNLGATSASSTTLNITTAAAAVAQNSSGGGGGGALDWGWLALLAVGSAWALRRRA